MYYRLYPKRCLFFAVPERLKTSKMAYFYTGKQASCFHSPSTQLFLYPNINSSSCVFVNLHNHLPPQDFLPCTHTDSVTLRVTDLQLKDCFLMEPHLTETEGFGLVQWIVLMLQAKHIPASDGRHV